MPKGGAGECCTSGSSAPNHWQTTVTGLKCRLCEQTHAHKQAGGPPPAEYTTLANPETGLKSVTKTDSPEKHPKKAPVSGTEITAMTPTTAK